MLHSLVLFLVAASMALAHFEMLSPEPRIVGSMSEQKNFPCSGPKNPPTLPGTRINYSTLNSTLLLIFYWDGSNDIYIGEGENPQVFPHKIGALPNAKMGEDPYEVKLDLSNVPAGFLKTGGKYTIQAVCHQAKFDIYQCADIIYDIMDTSTTSTTSTSSTVTTTSSVLNASTTTISKSAATSTIAATVVPVPASAIASASPAERLSSTVTGAGVVYGDLKVGSSATYTTSLAVIGALAIFL
ncbi:hypothetical protein HDU79_000681 [Rhizoclosmatium sp. JEL0117]|nr:hypothetical protein HDU79_000681 [Rhizoclosmatium sp. JEL0117]